jgi:hypothetical protein
MIERKDLLRRASRRLGCRKLGKSVRQSLKGHLRAAIRRKIVAADGDYVYCLTPTAAQLALKDLVRTTLAVMEKGYEYDREAVTRAAATHLGFSQTTDAFRCRMRSAFHAALRRGLLGRRGPTTIWRTD